MLSQASEDLGQLLFGAAWDGDLEAVTAMLARGANADWTCLVGERTPLLVAAEKGHTSVIRALISAGADVNWQDFRGWSPLMAAAASDRRVEILDLLLKAGADVHLRCNLNKTALDYALEMERLSAVRTLREFLRANQDLMPLERDGSEMPADVDSSLLLLLNTLRLPAQVTAPSGASMTVAELLASIGILTAADLDLASEEDLVREGLPRFTARKILRARRSSMVTGDNLLYRF